MISHSAVKHGSMTLRFFLTRGLGTHYGVAFPQYRPRDPSRRVHTRDLLVFLLARVTKALLILALSSYLCLPSLHSPMPMTLY